MCWAHMMMVVRLSETSPKTVLAAIALLLLSFAIGAVHVFYVVGIPHYLTSYLYGAAYVGTVMTLAYGLYKRSNFCRWSVAVVWLAAAAWALLALSAVTPAGRGTYLLQILPQVLMQATAGLLVLLPASSRWCKS